MKRKIVSAISIGTALIMSAFLFACDDDNKRPDLPDPGSVPEVLTPEEKLEKGITLLAESENLKGAFTATTSSDKSGKNVYSYTYSKRGDIASTSDGENDYVIDLGTGYGYISAETGATFEQYVPSGLYGYAVDAFKAELSDKLDGGDLDFGITEADGAIKLSIDRKTEINKYLELLGDHYGGTLYDIANELAGQNDKIIETVFDEMITMVISNKDINATYMISVINTQLKNLGFDVTFKDIFIKAGVTEQEYEAVGKRKAGEMVAGALTLKDRLFDYIDKLVKGQDVGTDNIDMSAELKAAFDAMFKDEIAKEALDNLETDLRDTKSRIISILKSVKVSWLTDKLVEYTGISDLRDMIANAVTFTKLKAEFTVGFADDGSIAAVDYSAAVAHNYVPAVTAAENDEQTESPSLLDDNNYAVTGSVTFDANNVDEVYIPDDLATLGDSVRLKAIAGKTETAVYLETGSESDVAVVIESVVSDNSTKMIDVGKIGYSPTDKKIIVDAQTVESVRPKTGAARLTVNGTVNGKPLSVTIYVPADYSLQSLAECVIMRNA